MEFQFATLDPRNTPEAALHNDKILSQPAFGVEVTLPALAARCSLGNCDPQHLGGRPDSAAIQDLAFAAMPPRGTMLATVRPDLDSLGGMAILELRSRGLWNSGSLEENAHAAERVALIAQADTFTNGDWPGKKPLPTQDQPWAELGQASEIEALAAMAAFVGDHKVPLDKRVEGMCEFLLRGVEPKKYREQVERDRRALVSAIEQGDLRIESAGQIALVTSTHVGGTALGYTQAPVVIIENPSFRFQGGEPHRKVTICQYRNGYVNLNGLANELSQREPGWGGSPTIIGSPQGTATTIGMHELAALANKHSAQ